MKRLLRSLLLGAILSALLCVGALAADGEPVKGGIYNISENTDVTLTPKDASGSSIPAGTDTSISGDYYANAVKLDVKASKLTEGNQYLLLVLKEQGVPTEKNIVYIDQAAAQNGSVSFTAYPSALTKGEYYVYLVGADKPFNIVAPAATFQYDQRYTLGDVNEDGKVNSVDAMRVLQFVVGKTTLSDVQLLAADVNGDKKVNPVDDMRILQFAVGIIDSF